MRRDVTPGTERAGGSAEAKFDRMARDWRKARLRGIRWFCLGGVVVLILVAAQLGLSALAFNLGALAGALVITWLAYRDLALPAYIDRWRVGAEGEKATGKALARLGDDWVVRHDLQGGYGNVDHLVVGPPGVFLVDSKVWHHGVTTMTSDGPIVTSDHDPDLVWDWRGLPARMRGAAGGTSAAIRQITDRRIRVHAVVAIWGDFPDRVQTRRDVTYIAAGHLVEWLREQPTRLGADDRAALRRLT